MLFNELCHLSFNHRLLDPLIFNPFLHIVLINWTETTIVVLAAFDVNGAFDCWQVYNRDIGVAHVDILDEVCHITISVWLKIEGQHSVIARALRTEVFEVWRSLLFCK